MSEKSSGHKEEEGKPRDAAKDRDSEASAHNSENASTAASEKDKKAKETVLPADKLKDIDTEPEDSVNDELIFLPKKSVEEDEFTMWSANIYLHNRYQDINIIVRYFLEILAVLAIILGPPVLCFLIMGKAIAPGKYLSPSGDDSDPWEGIMRRNLFIALWYIADVCFFILTESFLSAGAAVLVLFKLYQSAICWAFIQSVYYKRYYARMCLTLLFGFYLANHMYGAFKLPELSLSTPRSQVVKALLLWLGIYMGMLFLTKTLINFSLFEVKRSAYTEAIYALNYKAFVFKKLQAIAEAKKEGGDVGAICQEYVQEYDDGLYLKYRESIFPSSKEAEECASSIYKQLGKKELELRDIKRYFPEDHKDVFKYLAGVDAKDDTKEKVKQKHFTATAVELYYARKDMERTLRGRDTVFNKLELICSVIVSYGALIVLLLLFQMNARVFMASFGTSLLTFSWIFADSIKNIYNCFIFLLIIRPFNIGDKVVVNSEILLVYKIDLLTTTFLTTYKKLVYMSNTVLIATNIYNIARSPSQTETLTLEVGESTTYEQAMDLQKKASDQIKKAKSSFVDCFFRKITKGKLEYEILHRSNFQNSKQMKSKRNKVIRIFKKAMGSAGIEHSDSFEFSG